MRLEIMLSQNDLFKEGDLGHYIKNVQAHHDLALSLDKILTYLDANLEK